MNNRYKNFTQAKVERRRKQLEESVARYLAQLDTADRQDPSEVVTLKKLRYKEKIEAVADRGYFNGEEIKACEGAGVTVTLPKPMTSGAKAEGRFGKQDFVYLAEEDVYRCPAGEQLTYRMTTVENGQKMRRYWTNACRACPLKAKCTKGPERRITRWEHEQVVEAVQERLDKNPEAMRTRRETVEHPFGTLKMRMGATHFLCKSLPKVATEMALMRARLQHDARAEYRRHQAAARGDHGLRRPDCRLCTA